MKILRPSTPVDPCLEAQRRVQGRGRAVADGQRAGHARAGRRGTGRSRGPRRRPPRVAAVDAARRALVGRAEGHPTVDVVALDPDDHGRRQRVGQADQRAVVEEGLLVAAGVGRLGEALVGVALRVLLELGSQALEGVGGDSAAPPRGRRWPPAGRSPCASAPASRRCSTLAGREMRRSPSSCQRSLHQLADPRRTAPGARRHGHQAKSTTTGAWSDGFSPLRAFRSMRTAPARAASGGVARTWSMRMPLPLWKLPAR